MSTKKLSNSLSANLNNDKKQDSPKDSPSKHSPLKTNKNEGTPKPIKRNRTGSADNSTSTSGAQVDNKTTDNPTSSGNNNPEKVDNMRLNVVHLLFIHGLLVNFYRVEGLETKMKHFLHDLILMFEIYIDSGNPSDELQKTFNYKPLTTSDDEF